MFLTKFPVNMTRRETRALLASPYRMHAAIAGSFSPSGEDENEGRVLWRVDHMGNGGANLYIVSPKEPSLVGLDEQIGWPDLEHQWQTRDYDVVLNKIANGQRYRFRLVANPVVSRRNVTDQHDRSKRMAHVTALQQESWLIGAAAYEALGVKPPQYLLAEEQSRAERNGFMVERGEADGQARLVASDSRQWRFRQGKNGNWIRLVTVRYDGVLRVVDEERLRHALTFGIGRGKGFGCGLLTLAPIAPS